MQRDPYVYDAAGEIDGNRLAAADGTSQDGKDRVYRVFFNAKPVELDGGDKFLYDLRAHPEDVCIQVRGGNMIGSSYATNVRRLPADLIARAVRGSPK